MAKIAVVKEKLRGPRKTKSSTYRISKGKTSNNGASIKWKLLFSFC